MGMMDNTLKAAKDLSPYLMAIFGTVFAGYISIIMLGYLDVNVVPSLGLNNSSTGAATAVSAIIRSGVDGVISVTGITTVSVGLMALATILAAFGFRFMEGMKITTSNLINLMKKIGLAVSVYVGIVFILAIIRILAGYLEEKVTTSLGFAAGSWILAKLALVTGFITTIIDGISPILSLVVALITLGLVVGAFGYKFDFKLNFGGKNKNSY